MKNFLWTMAAIFGIAAIVLFSSSLVHWEGEVKQLTGISTTINIQATVFCAACAVISAANVIGAVVLGGVQKAIDTRSKADSLAPSSSSGSYSSAISGMSPIKTESPAKKYEDEERNKRILSEGGWKCTCGRVNYHYVSTCACGINKRELLMKKANEQQPQEK